MNIKCNFNQEKISAYLDNELSQEERLLIEAHLKGCPECTNLLNALRKSDHVFADYAERERDALYWEKYNLILKQKLAIQSKPFSQVRRYLFWKALVPTAAAILIVFSIYRFLVPPTVNRIPTVNVPHIITEAEGISEILAGSESALVNLVNLNENDSAELMVFQTALGDSGLVEQIRDTKDKTKDEGLQNHLKKLEAVFTWAQNGNSPEETIALKEVILENGLIEENRLKRSIY